jgi:hypothetical protein
VRQAVGKGEGVWGGGATANARARPVPNRGEAGG